MLGKLLLIHKQQSMAKIVDALFMQVLVRFLRNAASGQPTGKRLMMLPVLASKLLLRAFASEPNWPLELVQVSVGYSDTVGSKSNYTEFKQEVSELWLFVSRMLRVWYSMLSEVIALHRCTWKMLPCPAPGLSTMVVRNSCPISRR
jgi:hypothetical protein